MTHPYREKHRDPPPVRAARARLDASSVAFGLFCALVGQALAGPGCALAVTVVGVFLLLLPPRR